MVDPARMLAARLYNIADDTLRNIILEWYSITWGEIIEAQRRHPDDRIRNLGPNQTLHRYPQDSPIQTTLTETPGTTPI